MKNCYCVYKFFSVYVLFTLPNSDTDSDSNSDCKPNGYIIICRTFHIAQSQIPILTLDRIGISTQICEGKIKNVEECILEH